MLLGIFPSGGTLSSLSRARNRVREAQSLVDRYGQHVDRRIDQAIADRVAVITTMKEDIRQLNILAGLPDTYAR